MERPAFIKNYNPYRFLVIFYIVGLAGHLFPFTRSFMLSITPFALLISWITIIIPFIQNKEWKTLIFFIVCGIAGFIAEVIGVNYGILFGDYSYGDVLGFGIFGAPLVIGLNWIIILTGSLSLSGILFKNKIIIVLAAVIFSVVFDFIMEPVAVFFTYWNWKPENIPLTNYFTWGALILIFSLTFICLKFTLKSKLPAFLFTIQFIYFFILRVLIYFKILK